MKVPHVIRVKDTYHFRYTIPKDCRDHFQGRSVFKKSLKTDDIDEAQKQAEKLAKIWRARIEKIRAQKLTKEPEESKPLNLEAVAEEFKKSIHPYIEKQIHRCLALPNAELRKTLHVSIENSIEAYRRCILKGSYTDQELVNLINPFAETDQFALDTCMVFEPRGILENDVLGGVARKVVPIILDGLLELKTAIEEALHISSAHITSSAPPVSTGKMISEVLSGMLQSTFRAEKTTLGIKANVELLIEWRGDIPIRTLTRDDLLDFRDNCLRKLPINATKQKIYDGMTIQDVIDTYEGNRFITNRTVNNKMNSIFQLMNYALETTEIDFAPIAKLKIPEEKKKGGREFTNGELKEMIGLLENSEKHPSRYWVPLLGMYTGARLNELCQLHTNDVYQQDGVWVIDINDNDTARTHKHLKNESSERLVPVHPELIRRGFDKFVLNRQKQCESPIPLFKDLSYRENHGYRSRLSNWFNQKFKSKFYKGPTRQKNFHSLRYSFIQQCQNQDDPLDDRAIMELTGHALTNAGISSVHLGYAGRLKPKALYEQISKLDYGF
jgi:integrase